MAAWTGATALALFGLAAQAAENVPPRAATERTAEIPVAEARTFALTTDLGSVSIIPQPTASVIRYTVHLETDAQSDLAKVLFDRYTVTTRNNGSTVSLNGLLPTVRSQSGRNAQFYVQYTVYVPASLSVEVHTGAGDIQTGDIGGHALLVTDGGNVTTGRVGMIFHPPTASTNPIAKIETQGGHITVVDVNGDLDAFTAGGFIQVHNVAGFARLHSGGGHIRVAEINGNAQLETDGGNITVGRAGAYVGARTAGGQIDFGEVHGSIHASTGGGGVRVMYVSGPMEVATTGGGICLTRVSNAVRAETGNGTITAWITPDSGDSSSPVRLPGASQLASGTGDIVVYVPRNLAATIDASVENGGMGSIDADPALGLIVQTPEGRATRASGTLNGGGATLRLRSVSGNIRLKFVDQQASLRQSLQKEQQERLAQKLSQVGYEEGPRSNASVQVAQAPPSPTAPCEGMSGAWDAMRSRLEVTFFGGVREDTEDFKKRLVVAPAPDYPKLAKSAGIQGVVRLQVRARTDGTLVVEKVLEGEPALVDAAMNALQQWRATPEDICGRKVDVISTLAFNFQLR
jgi:hypothetical protein